MKIFKVWPGENLNPCCEKTLDAIGYWLDMAEKGDIVKIEIMVGTGAFYTGKLSAIDVLSGNVFESK